MSQLPRLLYISDVSVDSTSCGAALIYRLLENYPADRLLIVEKAHGPSLPEYRLRNVCYKRLSIGSAVRWQNTRFSSWAASWLTVTASTAVNQLRPLLGGFDPQCVLTVICGYSWLTAAQFAREAKLPLHVIVHDDWFATPMASWLKRWRHRQFAKVYKQAMSRLCVSPYMEAEYRERYCVSGQVLYPSRAKICPSFDRVPRTYAKKQGALIGAYAGNVQPSYACLIVALAKCLEKQGGYLMLFGAHSTKELRALGLNRAAVLPQGFVPSEELVCRLRNEGDFLFVPMSFDSGAIACNMRLGFPSKLADYTATGLPLLICGPHYCSAVRWAKAYAPVAEVVTSFTTEEINQAVLRLQSLHHRERLGQASLSIGRQLFSHGAALEIFYSSLQTNARDLSTSTSEKIVDIKTLDPV